jgi:5-methyltetrahydropteroyltriglutamate--homocysteine methyltransferase
MKRSTDRFLTTHAGSLIRPPEVLDITPSATDAATKATLGKAVAEVVGREHAIGLDFISDGEFGKSSWFSYVIDRLAGFDVRPTEPPAIGVRGKDAQRYADFFARDGMSRMGTRQHVCTGPITYTGKPVMQRDVDNFVAALKAAGHPLRDAFLPVVSPTSISVDHVNEYYPSERAYLEAIAEALHYEYKTITDAGLTVQLDDAILTHWWDRMTDEGRDYRGWVAQSVEIINHALRGIPEEQVRYHVCWGSWPGPHTSDVPLREIVDLVLQIKAQGYSIEAANPRHEWEWVVWEDVNLPEGKMLIPGVISHAISHVEHPELVAQRLTRFGRLVGRENVVGSTDCGFAQGQGTARQAPTIMWAKLQSLVEGARLASSRTLS